MSSSGPVMLLSQPQINMYYLRPLTSCTTYPDYWNVLGLDPGTRSPFCIILEYLLYCRHPREINVWKQFLPWLSSWFDMITVLGAANSELRWRRGIWIGVTLNLNSGYHPDPVQWLIWSVQRSRTQRSSRSTDRAHSTNDWGHSDPRFCRGALVYHHSQTRT